MAPIHTIELSITKTSYTFQEAIEYMKMKDQNVTAYNEPPTRWRSVKTGKEVIIGYTS